MFSDDIIGVSERDGSKGVGTCIRN